MVEDTPTSTKHVHRRHVMGTIRGIFPRSSISANLMSLMAYDRVVVWYHSMNSDSWSYLGMLHI
jgi:hypothetical protein